MNDDSLAKEVYLLQKELQLPGLVDECVKFLASFSLSLDEMTSFNKYQWKRIINDKIHGKKENELRDHLQKYKKFNFDETEPYELKPYLKELSLTNAQLRFKMRADTCPTIKTHFKSDPGYAKDLWVCPEPECNQLDTILHIQYCDSYSDLRRDLDLHVYKDLVQYFSSVIDRRNLC